MKIEFKKKVLHGTTKVIVCHVWVAFLNFPGAKWLVGFLFST